MVVRENNFGMEANQEQPSIKKNLKLILQSISLSTRCEIALWYTSQSLIYESTLIKVEPCCRQAQSHSLKQCWLRHMSPYGVTWQNELIQASTLDLHIYTSIIKCGMKLLIHS